MGTRHCNVTVVASYPLDDGPFFLRYRSGFPLSKEEWPWQLRLSDVVFRVAHYSSPLVYWQVDSTHVLNRFRDLDGLIVLHQSPVHQFVEDGAMIAVDFALWNICRVLEQLDRDYRSIPIVFHHLPGSEMSFQQAQENVERALREEELEWPLSAWASQDENPFEVLASLLLAHA
ncbi:MAG: hypothetical protein RBU37_25295 [Myxococcota bacterium]|jgi:hypothetical protein|nr:hypothetical protein [Myxococcota bacterium]